MKIFNKFSPFLIKIFIPAFIIGILSALITLWLSGFSFFKILELKTLDVRYRIGNMASKFLPEEKITIIAIDDETDQKMSNLKIPRVFWVPLISKSVEDIFNAGANAVVIDIIQSFSTDDYFDEFFKSLKNSMVKKRIIKNDLSLNEFAPRWDQKFAQSINGKNAILSSFINDSDKKWIKPISQLSYAVDEENIGLANFNLDEDGLVRSFKIYLTDDEGKNHFNLGIIAAEKYLKQPVKLSSDNEFSIGENKIHTSGNDDFNICYSGKSSSFNYIPLWLVFDKTRNNDKFFFEKEFKDKLVLIGSTTPADQDIKKTPFGLMPGVEIHANAINSLISGYYLKKAPEKYNFYITIILCLLTPLFCFIYRGMTGERISAGIILIYALINIYVFLNKNMIINMTTPLIGAVLAYGISFVYKYTVEDREKNKIKKIFERYVSVPVVNKIMEDPKSLDLGGQEAEVSVLFSDINGFTPLCEQLSPNEVIELLNEYFAIMIEVIFKHNGTLKQFVGDEIMAIFGAPYRQLNHARLAAETALEMIEGLEIWKEKMKASGRKYFDIKIGLNCGKVICGNVGSEKRTEYAAVGDVVNTASRIMGLNSVVKSKTRILAGKEFFEKIKDEFNADPLGSYPVKGKNAMLEIYEITGKRSECN